METLIYLDTHVVAWLYAGRADLLSDRARDLLEKSKLLISPVVVLELEYLREIGRLSASGARVVEDLGGRIGLEQCDLPFVSVIEAALHEKWTRDPFDRIVVAHANLRRAPLLTKDRFLQAHYRRAVW